jgi:hypothetical protein
VDFYQWVSLTTVVIVVPLTGFWLALRQDSVRWYREKRADLYVDLLTEADAERNSMQRAFTRAEMARIDKANDDRRGPSAVEDFDQDAERLPDTHLPPRARALLGARSAAYASVDVLRRFNELQGIGFFPEMKPSPMTEKAKVDMAFDALERQIKRELHRYAPRRERLRARRNRGR